MPIDARYRKLSNPLASVFVFLALLLALAGMAHAIAPDYQWEKPDTCLNTFGGSDLQTGFAGSLANSFGYFYTTDAVQNRQVALIIPGNGFSYLHYHALAEHLAMNGVVTAIIGNPGDEDEVLVRIQAMLDEMGWDKNDAQLGIALIGHSRGGGMAVGTALLNRSAGHDYPIRAVVTLGPTTNDASESLQGEHTPGFLAIYGSQDEDVDGFNQDSPREAFAIYDAAATENSTVCADLPCNLVQTPPIDKTMVFVYGADHAGLVGLPVLPDSNDPQDLEYIHADDQLCIVKAYVTGFLRWQMLGITVYRSLMRGDWLPDSLEAIDSFVPDALGNPAGTDLRMYYQSSPHERARVQNFVAGAGNPTVSGPQVVVHHLQPDFANGTPHYVRHATDLAVVEWSNDPQNFQWVLWDVPSDAWNGSSFSHFAMRLGQLHASVNPNQNTAGQDQQLWVGLQDGDGAISWTFLDEIPYPDLYTNNPSNARSAMHTERIPMTTIRRSARIDDIRRVILVFPPATSGTILVDSLEWQRDY